MRGGGRGALRCSNIDINKWQMWLYKIVRLQQFECKLTIAQTEAGNTLLQLKMQKSGTQKHHCPQITASSRVSRETVLVPITVLLQQIAR